MISSDPQLGQSTVNLWFLKLDVKTCRPHAIFPCSDSELEKCIGTANASLKENIKKQNFSMKCIKFSTKIQ